MRSVVAAFAVAIAAGEDGGELESGGIVARIPVKNGDRVRAGDMVLRLDDTQARANLGIVASQLIQLAGRKARLEAERDLADNIRFPDDFLADDEARAIAEGESRLFAYRRAFRRGRSPSSPSASARSRRRSRG